MRVIDFLQLIADLEKQTKFFYQKSRSELLPVTEVEITEDVVLLHTKKASTHNLHQWELVTLLSTINTKTIFIKVVNGNTESPFYGIQLHDGAAYLK